MLVSCLILISHLSVCPFSLFKTETHKPTHRLEPVCQAETFLDKDYCLPQNTGYNYLDPNYFPANRWQERAPALASRAGPQPPGHSVHGSIIQVKEMLTFGREGTADGPHLVPTRCRRGMGWGRVHGREGAAPCCGCQTLPGLVK